MKNIKGWTLIEILVVLFLMSLLISSISFSYKNLFKFKYNKFKKNLQNMIFYGRELSIVEDREFFLKIDIKNSSIELYSIENNRNYGIIKLPENIKIEKVKVNSLGEFKKGIVNVKIDKWGNIERVKIFLKISSNEIRKLIIKGGRGILYEKEV